MRDENSQGSPTSVSILLVHDHRGLLLVLRGADGLRFVGGWDFLKYVVLVNLLIVRDFLLDKYREIVAG